MTQISAVDWPGKRMFLHTDTVTLGFDAIEAGFEVKELIAANSGTSQGFKMPILMEGLLPKDNIGERFTPRYALLLSGWRFVPYGSVGHVLLLNAEIISEDGISDHETFDRSTLPPTIWVDIVPDYDQVEVIIKTVGTGPLTPAQQAQLAIAAASTPEANAAAVGALAVDSDANLVKSLKVLLAVAARRGVYPAELTNGSADWQAEDADGEVIVSGTVDAAGNRTGVIAP